jgi:hypothetical protein
MTPEKTTAKTAARVPANPAARVLARIVPRTQAATRAATTRATTTLAKVFALAGILVAVSVLPGCATASGGSAGATPASAGTSPTSPGSSPTLAPTSVSPTLEPTSVSPTTLASGPVAASATSPRAADIALSLTSAGRLRLQVVVVDARGAPTAASLRVSVGSTNQPGTGVVASASAGAVQRLLLPGVTQPGRTYYYDLVLRNAGGSARYPATGRYGFVAPASSGQPLTVLAWGDSRPDSLSSSAPTPVALRQIVARALTHRPALALASGDLVNVAGDSSTTSIDAKYRRFLAVENGLARRLPVMPSTGNHEGIEAKAGLAAWAKWYALPTPADRYGRYYSFTDGDVHFVVLSTSGPFGEGSLGYYGPADPRNSAQARWLVSDLRRSIARWTVVMVHHPLFDPKPTDYWATTGRAERNRLALLFAHYGVDLVIQGHSHFYRRHEQPVSLGGRRYQMPYVTEGGGGAPLYAVSSVPRDSHDRVAYSAYGYVILRSSGSGRLTAVAYKVNATTGAEAVGDSFSLQQIPRGAVTSP